MLIALVNVVTLCLSRSKDLQFCEITKEERGTGQGRGHRWLVKPGAATFDPTTLKLFLKRALLGILLVLLTGSIK